MTPRLLYCGVTVFMVIVVCLTGARPAPAQTCFLGEHGDVICPRDGIPPWTADPTILLNLPGPFNPNRPVIFGFLPFGIGPDPGAPLPTIPGIGACNGISPYEVFSQREQARWGYRTIVYRDELGDLRVGVGHLVTPADALAIGGVVTPFQIKAWWDADSASAFTAAQAQAKMAGICDGCFVSVLASVNYQMGTAWITKYPRVWAAIMAGNYDEAAEALNGTAWQRATPQRVRDFQIALNQLPPKSVWNCFLPPPVIIPPKICDFVPDLCNPFYNPCANGAPGGGPGPPPGFPPINSCGETVQATPATFLATLARLKDSGGTIMLDPGNYPKFDLRNRSGCTLTVRCSQTGQCTLAPGDQLTKVSNFVLDGVVLKGGSFGIKINSGQNILITRSRFVEMSFAGITVYPYPDNENIQITGNSFENAKRGCTYNGNCSGTFPDGRPMPGMDYGVNAYDGKSIAIQGNTFGTLFGHAISLKHSVKYAYISNNIFNKCGSQCVELGQQPNTVANPNWSVGEAVVTGNTFKDTIYKVVVVVNIRRATITGNTFINAPRPIRVETYNPCPGCISGGIPPDRTVIDNPNTYN